MIEYAKRVDTIVLASGDGDYTVVVDKIRHEHNVSVEIYGVPDLTASSLIELGDTICPNSREHVVVDSDNLGA